MWPLLQERELRPPSINDVVPPFSAWCSQADLLSVPAVGRTVFAAVIGTIADSNRLDGHAAQASASRCFPSTESSS